MLRNMLRVVVVAGIGLFVIAGVARADYDEKDIAKIAEALKAGKGITDSGRYPKEYLQQVNFAAGDILYRIDFRDQLCFALNLVGLTMVTVPCAALKKGYPLFAPLITWND